MSSPCMLLKCDEEEHVPQACKEPTSSLTRKCAQPTASGWSSWRRSATAWTTSQTPLHSQGSSGAPAATCRCSYLCRAPSKSYADAMGLCYGSRNMKQR